MAKLFENGRFNIALVYADVNGINLPCWCDCNSNDIELLQLVKG